MIDRNLARGIFLIALSLLFGITASHYSIGDFARAGPGLFPIVVSSMLFVIGVATVVQSRFTAKVKLGMHYKNIAVILGSLISFAVVTMFVNMLTAVVVMVFIATLAGTNYSWKRNIKISIGLCLMALVFAKFLGMNLPLY